MLQKHSLLGELPYVAIIVLGLVGILWASVSSAPTATYWVILTPVTALICIAGGWRPLAEGGGRIPMITTQIVQWAAVLVAMYLITISDTRRLLNSDAIVLMLLTLLALGVMVSGLNLRAWKLCVTAMFLAIAVPITVWVERAALLLLVIGGALIALGFLNWWRKASRPALAG
jgi:hypothetical protein